MHDKYTKFDDYNNIVIMTATWSQNMVEWTLNF